MALELGGRTVAEWRDAMSGAEFDDWLNYFDLHPYGTEWEDVRMAVLSANICTALSGKAQKPGDHQAKYSTKKSSVKMSPKRQEMMLRSIVAEARQFEARKKA